MAKTVWASFAKHWWITIAATVAICAGLLWYFRAHVSLDLAGAITVSIAVFVFLLLRNPAYWVKYQVIAVIGGWMAVSAAGGFVAAFSWQKESIAASVAYNMVTSPLFHVAAICIVVALLNYDLKKTDDIQRGTAPLPEILQQLPEQDRSKYLLNVLQTQSKFFAVDTSDLPPTDKVKVVAAQLGLARLKIILIFGGAMALGAVALFYLSAEAFNDVKVYLRPKGNVKIASFHIAYEHPKLGPKTEPGKDNYAEIRLPRGTTELVINDVPTTGYEPKWLADGKDAPWKVPIVDGQAECAMVEKKLKEAAFPTSDDAFELVKQKGLSFADIDAAPKVKPANILWTIFNDSDRVIDVVLYDVTWCYEDGKPRGKPLDGNEVIEFNEEGAENVPVRVWIRDLAPQERRPIRTLEECLRAKGHFAVFVRWIPTNANHSVQVPVGVVQLFDKPRPMLTLERIEGTEEFTSTTDKENSNAK